MKKILSFLLITTMFTSLSAQDLRRRASLGFRPAPVDSAMAASVGLGEARGMLVQGIMPGGSIHDLACNEGDILLEINGIAVDNIPALIQARNSMRAGDEVKARVFRKGKEVKLTGKAVGVPLETSRTSEVLYGQFSYKGGQIRTIVNKPRKPGKHPVIFFIPGYTCASVDNFSPMTGSKEEN